MRTVNIAVALIIVLASMGIVLKGIRKTRRGDIMSYCGNIVQLMNRTTKYTIPVIDVLSTSGFTNQPADDDVQVISSSASDTGLITIWYEEQTTGILKSATKNLNGTTAVDMIGSNTGGNVVGVFLGDIYGNPKFITPAAGTITVREKSGQQTITTLSAGDINTGRAIFKLPHKDIMLVNFTGNSWYAVDYNYDDEVGRKYMTGLMARDEHISEKENDGLLTVHSDTDGSTIEITVWE